jgi:AcrR family transcriptional regulator
MSEPEEPELPRSLALAWGVAAHPQRGPKRELSIERIVDAAIAIADENGLGAVSMAAIATSLGFTPMSLYRYVSAKDDLVVLMQDQAVGVPSEAIRDTLAEHGWRAGLAAWAAGNVAVYREHPWVLDVPVAGVAATPHSAAWLDLGLETLAELPITEPERLATVLVVMGQCRWQGLVERSYVEAARGTGGDIQAVEIGMEAMMRYFITPEAFPSIARAVAGRAFAMGAPDPFAYGIERVLDGIEGYVAARAAGAPPPEPPATDPLDEAAGRDPKVKEAVKARREAEKQLREARKRERERLREARERLRHLR